jgi:hypothetical protein
MPGIAFDIFQTPFFSAGEPFIVELAAPNISTPLSTLTLSDCCTSHETVFSQPHNAHLTVSGIIDELRPQ